MNGFRSGLTAALILLTTGCSTPVSDYIDRWFGNGPVIKPAELVVFKQTATPKILWQANAGGAERFVFSPMVDESIVAVAGAGGQVLRLDAGNGKQLVRIDSKLHLSGGVGGNRRMMIVGSPKGDVLAYDGTGKEIWKSQINSDVLSAPQVEQDIVIVRSGDGRLFGLDVATGVRKWVYQRTMPALTVRTHVSVQPYRGAVFAGFPSGRLVAISASNGNLIWEATVALPKGATELERVADVTSIPVTDGKIGRAHV